MAIHPGQLTARSSTINQLLIDTEVKRIAAEKKYVCTWDEAFKSEVKLGEVENNKAQITLPLRYIIHSRDFFPLELCA
jgi:hypothetical protein